MHGIRNAALKLQKHCWLADINYATDYCRVTVPDKPVIFMNLTKYPLAKVAAAIVVAVVLFIITGLVSGYIVNHLIMPQPWVRFTIYEGFASLSLPVFTTVCILVFPGKNPVNFPGNAVLLFLAYLILIIPAEQVIQDGRYNNSEVIGRIFSGHYKELLLLSGRCKDLFFAFYLWQLLYFVAITYVLDKISVIRLHE